MYHKVTFVVLTIKFLGCLDFGDEESSGLDSNSVEKMTVTHLEQHQGEVRLAPVRRLRVPLPGGDDVVVNSLLGHGSILTQSRTVRLETGIGATSGVSKVLTQHWLQQFDHLSQQLRAVGALHESQHEPLARVVAQAGKPLLHLPMLYIEFTGFTATTGGRLVRAGAAQLGRHAQVELEHLYVGSRVLHHGVLSLKVLAAAHHARRLTVPTHLQHHHTDCPTLLLVWENVLPHPKKKKQHNIDIY